MTGTQGEYIWYELLTTNADAAQKFYGDLMGWRFTGSGQEGLDYRIVHAGEEGVAGILQLTDGMVAEGARPVWLGYVSVDNVDATVAAISESGGGVRMPAMEVPNVGRIAMVSDPQGVPFYIMRPSGEGTSTAFSSTAIGHCAWNELATRDMQQSLDFYGRHFGWRKGDAMPMGEAGDYQFIVQNDTTIGAFSPYVEEGREPGWLYYFHAADIDAAMERISAGGGKLLHGPHQVPGDDWIVIGLDPQGAAFALVGSRRG